MAELPDDRKGTGNPQREWCGENMKPTKCEHIEREQQECAFGWSKEYVKGSSRNYNDGG